jgi:hypothetical protein
MPRPKTPDELEQLIAKLAEENPKRSAQEMLMVLRKRAKQEGIQAQIPSARTIMRLKKKALGEEEEKRLQRRPFSWPESFLAGALPWEASNTCLELLGFYRLHGNAGRPTNAEALWFWRASIATPDDTPICFRLDIAGSLARGGDPRGIEAAIALKPWASQANWRAYNKALRFLRARPYDPLSGPDDKPLPFKNWLLKASMQTIIRMEMNKNPEDPLIPESKSKITVTFERESVRSERSAWK